MTTHTTEQRNVRALMTAGPTHEPIDSVRYLANRSSGRLGISLAAAAADRGWDVTLLLGPTPIQFDYTHFAIERFETTEDLRGLLAEHAPGCDLLVMAAAVADYRPRRAPGAETAEKVRRSEQPMTLELEPTPDLLAEAAACKRPEQVFVGFALEPRSRLLESAAAKVGRKGLDAIVANPLETMNSEQIEAWLIWADGGRQNTDGPVGKDAFAGWLLDRLAPRVGPVHVKTGERPVEGRPAR